LRERSWSQFLRSSINATSVNAGIRSPTWWVHVALFYILTIAQIPTNPMPAGASGFTPAQIGFTALPSGIYTIENVKYRNWAMLFDANEGDVVAGSSPHANVGEKVRALEMWI
jgi:hypothetical protein